jgi:16S rRNA (guanine966-N2)-methyltransferase
MRIIAGTLRSRTLQAPPGLATRPTSDRLRETLFNVLAPRIEGAHFLDLYGGSGAVGMEALSRGARRVVFVERAASALKILRANLARLGLKDGCEIYSGTVAGYLCNEIRGPGFDIVFLDPPYDAAGEYQKALGLLGGDVHGLLCAGAVVIAEHRRKEVLAESYGQLRRTRLLQQGDASLSFYAVNEPQTEEHGGEE